MRALKSLALFGLLITSNAFAVAPGFYMGLMTGPATNSGSEQQVLGDPPTFPDGTINLVTATPKSKQWGSRIYMGYQIGYYAGIEAGLTYFSGINYDTKNLPTCTGPSVRVRDFDIVGKGIIPFSPYFDVYGKAGVAITYVSESGAFNPPTTNNPGNGSGCGRSKYTTKYNPTLSVGASMALSQNWVIDASINRVMVGGLPGNVDYFAVGFSYHFVDVYCGQFLCDD